ncbi:MAG: hypothetical protein IKE33_04030, partial [Erysipelotrichaceae bacterium]|nr:hypothetical protein [Erysipelotrichaceae bacterium]
MKKGKRKVRRSLVYLMIVILLALCAVLVINSSMFKDAYKTYQLTSKGYSEQQVELIKKDQKVFDYVLNNDYDGQLIELLGYEGFDFERYEDY